MTLFRSRHDTYLSWYDVVNLPFIARKTWNCSIKIVRWCQGSQNFATPRGCSLMQRVKLRDVPPAENDINGPRDIATAIGQRLINMYNVKLHQVDTLKIDTIFELKCITVDQYSKLLHKISEVTPEVNLFAWLLLKFEIFSAFLQN